MAGQTYTRLAPGDRCILNVDSANYPTGWWWGVVDEIEWHDSLGGWGNVQAHITGPFGFASGYPPETPAYGVSDIKPDANYIVYPADRDTAALIRRLRHEVEQANGRAHELAIRLDEARAIIKSICVQPDVGAL